VLILRDINIAFLKYSKDVQTSAYLEMLFSSFFATYDAMNEYCGDRNVSRKLSTVDENRP